MDYSYTMIPADAPLEELASTLAKLPADAHSEGNFSVQWAFSQGKFQYTPVFSDTAELIRDLLGDIADLGYRSFTVQISSSAEQEDSTAGRENSTAGQEKPGDHQLPRVRYQVQCSRRTLYASGDLDSVLRQLMENREEKLSPRYDVSQYTLHLRCSVLCTEIEYSAREDGVPVDLDELKKKIQDGDMYRTMIQLFKDKTPQRIIEWKKAFQKGDVQEAHRIIHSLKGSAMNISALRLSQLARRLEIALKIHHTDDAEKLLDLVEKELQRVMDYLERNTP
ncbi:Hpt domain-containing protein [Salinispira pacifica]|nr:Hpt domain-containing protein [Salinispira pacifica]